MTTPSSRLVALTLVGSFLGVAGERILGRVSTMAILAGAVVILASAVTVLKRRVPKGQDASDTLAGTVIVTAIGAAATILANRAVSGAPRWIQLVVLAVVVLVVVGILLAARRRRV